MRLLCFGKKGICLLVQGYRWKLALAVGEMSSDWR